MFKVSFKETDKNPSKAVIKKGRTTTVVLKGVVKLPEHWHDMLTSEISDWIGGRTKVEIYENIVENTLIIYSTGKAVCREDDKFDAILGERLAEVRAKYYIYKFFHDLCYRLYEYYNRILFGPDGVVDAGSDSCIAKDLKKYEALCIKESHHIGELLKSKENG